MIRPTTPRIAPLDDAALTDGQRVLAEIGASHVTRTFARRADLLAGWLELGKAVITGGHVSGRDREFVLLRTALRTNTPYEWANHAAASLGYGVTVDELRALGDDDATWPEPDATLLAAVDEICADDGVGDATWARLRAAMDDDAIIELLFIVGYYRLTSGLLNSLGVQPEPGLPGLGELPEIPEPVASSRPSGTADGPARPDGRWQVTFRHPAGEQQLTLDLTTDGDRLTGTIANTAVGIRSDIADGTVDGGHLTGTTRLSVPIAMTLTWDGTVVGDTIAGTVTLSGGAGTFPFDGVRA